MPPDPLGRAGGCSPLLPAWETPPPTPKRGFLPPLSPANRISPAGPDLTQDRLKTCRYHETKTCQRSLLGHQPWRGQSRQCRLPARAALAGEGARCHPRGAEPRGGEQSRGAGAHLLLQLPRPESPGSRDGAGAPGAGMLQALEDGDLLAIRKQSHSKAVTPAGARGRGGLPAGPGSWQEPAARGSALGDGNQVV